MNITFTDDFFEGLIYSPLLSELERLVGRYIKNISSCYRNRNSFYIEKRNTVEKTKLRDLCDINDLWFGNKDLFNINEEYNTIKYDSIYH